MFNVNFENINKLYLHHGMSPIIIGADYNISLNLMVTNSLKIESCKPSPQNMVLLQAWVNKAKLDLDPLHFKYLPPPYLGTKAHGLCIQNHTVWQSWAIACLNVSCMGLLISCYQINPPNFYIMISLKYGPYIIVYIDGVFILTNNKGIGNKVCSRIYNLINEIQIAYSLAHFQNMLCAELYVIWLALSSTQNLSHVLHIY